MHRFFIEPAAISGDLAVLAGPEARHLRTVLRLTPGEAIILFDGRGTIYQARINQVNKDQVVCAILATHTAEATGPTLHLGQALLMAKKMDLVVQKATELGVAAIHPFTVSRCTAEGDSSARQSRWQRIAFEACKQSGRPAPPEISRPTDLAGLLSRESSQTMKLLFYEEEETTGLAEIFQARQEQPLHDSLIFLVGPESGFARDEVDRAKAAGFIPVTLGERVVRAETASIAATAILQFLLGGMRGRPTEEKHE